MKTRGATPLSLQRPSKPRHKSVLIFFFSWLTLSKNGITYLHTATTHFIHSALCVKVASYMYVVGIPFCNDRAFCPHHVMCVIHLATHTHNLPLFTVLPTVISQSPDAFYGRSGYSGYTSANEQLRGANETLSFRYIHMHWYTSMS